MGSGGGGGAADKSNQLLQEQIDQQKAEEARKLKSLYGDELVSLKSGGKMVYSKPQTGLADNVNPFASASNAPAKPSTPSKPTNGGGQYPPVIVP